MEEALQLYSKAKKLFLDISMNLRDWNSNSPELNRKIPGQDCMKKIITKVLGLQWDTITDQLMVNTKKFDNSMTATTKRQVLTTTTSLFNPLGYLTPAIVKMRLFLQNLWIQEKRCDDQLQIEDIETWQKIMAEMKKLSTISVPRHIGGENPQLLCFCYASEKAYATVIYLKALYEGRSDVNLLFSKSRIAPKQKVTILQLELLALLIGIRTLKFVSKELKCRVPLYTYKRESSRFMVERTRMIDTRSNIMPNMQHAKNRRKNNRKDTIRSQRIKNPLRSISYCSRKESLSKDCKPSSENRRNTTI